MIILSEVDKDYLLKVVVPLHIQLMEDKGEPTDCISYGQGVDKVVIRILEDGRVSIQVLELTDSFIINREDIK